MSAENIANANNRYQETRGLEIKQITEPIEINTKKVGLTDKIRESSNKSIFFFQITMPVVISGKLGHHFDNERSETGRFKAKISENLTPDSESGDEP